MLIAIDNENIEMMELLLGARVELGEARVELGDTDVELGDALLHAINEENVDAVELLLRAHQQQAGNKKNLEVLMYRHGPWYICFKVVQQYNY